MQLHLPRRPTVAAGAAVAVLCVLRVAARAPRRPRPVLRGNDRRIHDRCAVGGRYTVGGVRGHGGTQVVA